MTITYKECPICHTPIRGHTLSVGWAIRTHIRDCHPEVQDDIRKRENEIHDLIKSLRDDYPGMEIIL